MPRPRFDLRFPELEDLSDLPREIREKDPVLAYLASIRPYVEQEEIFAGKIYYFLPKQLLQLLDAEIGLQARSPHSWNRDWRIATDPRLHGNDVGYIDRLPIQSSVLGSSPLISISSEDA